MIRRREVRLVPDRIAIIIEAVSQTEKVVLTILSWLPDAHELTE